MWIQDNETSQMAIMNDARAMRDAAMANYISRAWHGVVNALAHLLHSKHGQPHAN